ncbi:hypothetical protein K0651_09880 [Ornithinimicrobium sp. Arc0846-15]|nr:hypothetical protein [Ornithinimicrobium laminariae]
MSDLKLFRIGEDGITIELDGGSMTLERSLQRVVEKNIVTLFGVQYLASECSTGAQHRCRIDSLGIDENNSPVIFEYKRDKGESVINQGLFYLDWLTDHKAEFQLLVQEKIDATTASAIDWSSPRVICIANQFTRYDEHAVQQMGRRIELVRYRDFNEELLALELVQRYRARPQAVQMSRAQLNPGAESPPQTGLSRPCCTLHPTISKSCTTSWTNASPVWATTYR